MTLVEIQNAFSDKYQYLKLEFFSKPHDAGEGSARKDLLANDLQLSKVRTKFAEDTLSFKSSMSVKELEQLFDERFGLFVQVFRKSGDTWLETTKTDDWTLDALNNKGYEHEMPIETKIDTYEVD